MTQTRKRLDGVFEGGGVKGIGLVGAVSVIEAAGYEFANLAGTSAGAIVATLLAAGYNAAELKQTINGIDFNTFEDPPLIGHIPFVGAVVDEIFLKGLYKGDVFLHLMRDLLAKKGVRTFRDLISPEFAGDDRYRFKVRVVASDISRGRMLVLPQDVRDYGMAPEDLEVALAVRMSMSIPYFFGPLSDTSSSYPTKPTPHSWCSILSVGLSRNWQPYSSQRLKLTTRTTYQTTSSCARL